ncbi:fatty acyl-CoA reductase wat-like [Planococcus citri]|uniref:fatty acyl-CoA reductase wat-like n=1 Tax=Planococcus citri TaxID=170843 RepID=UPI0031F9448F
MSSEVQNFFSSKTIFITGATGFQGQMLLSKLLCSCPEIRCIYLLIREKGGKRINERIKEIFDSSVFERAKDLHPDYESKVKAIQGDCFENHLGISDHDRAIIENEVDIVFHVASIVNYDAPLRKAGYVNVRSLDILLGMAKKMTKLKAFVYVSTAYSACTETKFIQEEFHNPPVKPKKLLSLIDQLDDTILTEITPRLMKSNPDMYLFTKSIAEDLCREKAAELPICIFRPAAVLPTYKEPAPGWINNSYGMAGVLQNNAMGLTKVICADKTCKASLVPGDYSTNALILSAYHMSRSWESKSEESEFEVPIINYSNCATKFGVTWGNFVKEYSKSVEKYPFTKMVNLPSLNLVNNYLLYRFLVFIHIIIPDIYDTFFLIIRSNFRWKKVYRESQYYLNAMIPITTQELTVTNHNISEIWSSLSKKDKKLFYCNLDDLNTEQYFDVLTRGIRLYLAKDKETTVQRAQQRRNGFLIAYYAIGAVLSLVGVVFSCLVGRIFINLYFN